MMGYRYEYDETGGYDCMYGAYIVMDDAGKTVLDVDFRHFGQKPCNPPSADCTIKAEACVRIIVAALNAAIPSDKESSDTPRTDELLSHYTMSRYVHTANLYADKAAALENFARHLERELTVSKGLEQMAYDQRDKAFAGLGTRSAGVSMKPPEDGGDPVELAKYVLHYYGWQPSDEPMVKWLYKLAHEVWRTRSAIGPMMPETCPDAVLLAMHCQYGCSAICNYCDGMTRSHYDRIRALLSDVPDRKGPANG